ncbi:MAG: cobyric acid synthase, partial [Thermodesulfobacteriota bacterium]
LEPDVLMNPILLKPSSDTGSQVILLGKAVENMDVNEYIRYKEQIISKVREAYLELAKSRDVIILEGAGSPAEINLKQHDITNMTMARIARANVLLTGDIDRGGVFASFIGTMELFEDWETDLTSGFIINRFRGQKSLLDPAIEATEQRTGKPMLGVVPYIGDLGLPEEDSVTFKSGWDKIHSSPDSTAVNIVCLDLPHISNFTDLEPLLQEPDVHVSILKTGSKLETTPDVLIIPGSKNVLGDLEALEESSHAEEIKRLAAGGQTLIVGICGGFQMLGDQVADPHGIESDQRTREGLGLLPIFTELAPQKSLSQVQATHLPSNTSLLGYEIHHGRTRRLRDDVKPVITNPEDREIGLSTLDERIWGTYLHGLFDADEFRRWFIDRVRKEKGLEPLGKIQTRYDLEENLDRLADIVRENLDMQKIYAMLK